MKQNKKVWPKKEKNKKKNDIKKDSNSNQIYKMNNMKKEDNTWLHKKDSVYSCFHENFF